jgi:hypothetical protein
MSVAVPRFCQKISQGQALGVAGLFPHAGGPRPLVQGPLIEGREGRGAASFHPLSRLRPRNLWESKAFQCRGGTLSDAMSVLEGLGRA